MMSVSALNTKIGSLLEATFVHVMVEGEVAQVTYHRSGHVYFSIKDDTSTLSCVMWRSTAARMKFRLESGEHIVIEGSISVYVPRGSYQLIAAHIEPYGKGTLAIRLNVRRNELVAATGDVHADRSLDHDMLSGLEAKFHPRRRRAPHHAAEGTRVVLDREIDMPAAVVRHLCYLPLDHHMNKGRFEERAYLGVEGGDGHHEATLLPSG